MSLNWMWTDKMGTCKFEDGTECTLYKGNAFTIAVRHYAEDNTYQVLWFAVDENHMKNMLGLSKDFDNMFDTYQIQSFELDTKYKETQKLVNLLARAKMKITITLY